MWAGNSREALLWVADQLSAELGCADGDETAGGLPSPGGERAMAGLLDSDDELLVASVRRGLARVAAALGGDRSDEDFGRAVGAALDGTELVMRGELLMGNAARLPALMPSFVFLVTLPVVDHDRAIELSRRTQRLVEGAHRSTQSDQGL